MDFFDFIFYRVYKQYISWGESDIPGVYALCVITLFPCLNVSSLIFFGIDILKIKSWNYDKILLLLCFLAVMIINYYRIYKVKGLSTLISKYDSMDKLKRRRLTIWMFLYFIASMVFLFISILN